VDAFGVGTSLDTSSDVPALDIAYKLQEYAGRARRKRSPGKQTWPGAKQVYREREASGRLCGDSITLADEAHAGEPLLREVMHGGRRTVASPTLAQIRQLCNARVAELPAGLQELGEGVGVSDYPTQVSDRIHTLAAQLDARAG
jgi:nicotinate phosphoribosyltransferase